MVPVSARDAYVVDLFRVRGGRTHDWLLHGDADTDTSAACSLPLKPRDGSLLEPGETWQEPRDEQSQYNPYGLIREVGEGQAAAPFDVTFTYPETPERGVRTHVVGGVPAQVYLGRSPSVRRSKSDSAQSFAFWMPQLVVRRHAEDTLTSLFAVVEEPYVGKPFLGSAQLLALTPADDFATALQVTHGDCVDTVISTADEAPYPERVTASGVRLRGRLGIVRRQAGKVSGAWLLEGESLAGEGFSVTCQTAAYSGEIEAAPRRAAGQDVDGFVTAATLPVGDTLKGGWVIVTHPGGHTHGYEIAEVRRQGDRSLIVLACDHGLTLAGDQTKEVFFPRRTFTGRNTFRISTAAGVNHAEGVVWQMKLGCPVQIELPR